MRRAQRLPSVTNTTQKGLRRTYASVPRSPERSVRRPCRASRTSSRTSRIGSSRCFLCNGKALVRLKSGVRRGDNTFDALMDAVAVCSLGQITQALFEVGGQYRRNM